MRPTDSNNDPFLQSLLDERKVLEEAYADVGWDNGDCTLEDWRRFLVSPAWKEMERQLTQTLQQINGSWQIATDLPQIRYLAGRAVQLDITLRLPHDTVRALEAQTTQPQPNDPEGEDE